MSRVLFISHMPLYPIKGGDQIRISQQLSALLDLGHDVDLVYLSHHSPEPESMRLHEPRLRGEKVFRVPLWRRATQTARSLFDKWPSVVNHFHHRPMRRYIDSVVKDYDFVFCGGMTEASYMLHHTDVPKFLDMTDSFTMNLDNDAAISSGLKRALIKAEARRMRAYERRCVEEFDRTAYISAVDRDYLPHPEGRAVIVGNSVAMPDDRQTCRFESHDIIYIGKMDYAPNVAAVERFALSIFPRVLREVPDARFVIIGANPTAAICALESDTVIVRGFVDDIGPVYRSAGVVVAPMMSGSGIQNKIIQSLARGCAVVTTPIGAEGLDADSGAFAVGSDDIRLAELCVELLQDPQGARDMGERARRYARDNFSPEVISGQFRAFVG